MNPQPSFLPQLDLGPTARAWLHLARTSPDEVRSLIAGMTADDVVGLSGPGFGPYTVPLGALLLATGHPVLRAACFEAVEANTAAARGLAESMLSQAVSWRDVESFGRCAAVLDRKGVAARTSFTPPQATALQSWVAQIRNWDSRLRERTALGEPHESAVALLLVKHGASVFQVMFAVVSSGQTAAALAVADAHPRVCTAESYTTSPSDHPVVRAWEFGHPELALALWERTISAPNPAVRRAAVTQVFAQLTPHQIQQRNNSETWRFLQILSEGGTEDDRDRWRAAMAELAHDGAPGLWAAADPKSTGVCEAATLLLFPDSSGGNYLKQSLDAHDPDWGVLIVREAAKRPNRWSSAVWDTLLSWEAEGRLSAEAIEAAFVLCPTPELQAPLQARRLDLAVDGTLSGRGNRPRF